MATRCPGCMKLKEKSPVCEHCGYNENVPNYSHQLPVGTKLHGQYTVGKVLGQGGFGITYIGWDDFLRTPIAIKEYYPNSFVNRECSVSLNVNCAGEGAEGLFHHNKERFLREARILAKLQNVPGIVRVQNLFEENYTAYIVMEYVEGIDLKHYIRMQNRVLTCQETFSVLRPIMYALQKVHEAELVHRDISPDNIMILPDGSAKLLDFGAAREVENAEVDRDLPQSTEAILKHGFAPIEQYRRRGSLGPWTDVYALCATMYYCMTGRVPNSAPERITDDDNIDWTRIPGLTRQQMDALEKGMTVMPKARIRSVQELWDGLFRSNATESGEEKTDSAYEKAVTEEKEQKHVQHSLKQEQQGKQFKEVQKLEQQRFKEQEKKEQQRLKERQKRMLKNGGSSLNQLLFPILVVLSIVLVLMMLKNRTKNIEEQHFVPETTFATIEETQEVTKITYKPLENPTYAEDAWKKNLMSATFFKKYCRKSECQTVTFLDTILNAPQDSFDISQEQDGSVLMWYAGTDLYIGANGGVAAPEDCTQLLGSFKKVKKMEFNNVFHTNFTTNMSKMFVDCPELIYLDLSGWDTSKVTDMESMFRSCDRLSFLDTSGWDTSNVSDMYMMFMSCSSLDMLDLSHWDTSSVISMGYMFACCSNLTSIEASGWNTSNITVMSFMFDECPLLNDLNFSGWDTSNVRTHQRFISNGATINGRPWEEFFQ